MRISNLFNKKLVYLFVLFSFFSSTIIVGASDIIVNVVPNPVALRENVRISLSSQQALKSAFLVVGKQELPLTKLSDRIYRVNLVAFEELFTSKASLRLTTVSGSTLTIPVSVAKKKNSTPSNDILLSKLDVKESKKITLNNEQQTVDLLQDKLNAKEKEKRDLQDKIKKLQAELAQQNKTKLDAKAIEKQKKDLDDLQKKLQQQDAEKQAILDDLMQKMKEYNEKQAEINKREEILNKLQSDVDLKASKFDAREKSLEEKSLVLNQEQQAINSRNVLVSEKELTIAKLKADIDKQNSELELRKMKTLEKEESLEIENKKIMQEKSVLDNEKVRLDALSKSISDKQTNLVLLNKELVEKQENLKKEEQRSYENTKEKETALKEQQAYILKLQSDLNANIVGVKQLETDQAKKSKELQVKSDEYQKKLDELAKLKEAVEKEKGVQEEIETEVKIKYELLSKLSKIIQGQLEDVRQEYTTVNDAHRGYITDLDQRVHYLTTLSYLMEKQNKEIHARNAKLTQQNFKLKYEREKDNYQAFSINPFFGLKVNDKTQYDNKEFGFRLTSYFGSRYMSSVGLSFINYTHTSGSVSNSFNSAYALIDLGYLLTHTDKTDLYGTLGIDADIFASIRPNYLTYGVNYRYFIKNDLVSRMSLRVSNVVTVEMGFEKYFGPMKRQNLMNTELNLEESELYLNNADVILSEADTFYLFKPQSVEIKDLDNHWSKNTSTQIVNLGIIQPVFENNNYKFNPNQKLTHLEAAQILLHTFYAQELLNTNTFDLDFSVIGVTDQPLKVGFSVLDSNKQLIEKLKENDYFPGQYSVSWDAGYKQDFGEAQEFMLSVSSQRQELKNDKKSFKIQQSAPSIFEKTFKVKRINALYEHPDYAFLSSNAVSYKTVQDKLALQLFDKEFNSISDKPITRLDFMLATSKILIKMGATKKTVGIDFSYYSDAGELTNEQKELLKTYVIELGYGGDEKKTLNPKGYITRAEVATIIHRVLFWNNEALLNKVFAK
jgi:hypothetical protein